MTSGQLSWIKRVQGEFLDKFGEKLVIDFESMVGEEERKIYYRRGVRVNNAIPKNFLDELLVKYNFTLEMVQSRSWGKGGKDKKMVKDNFLIEFSKAVMTNIWSFEYCASLIKRDRTLFYYYNNLGANRKQRSKKYMEHISNLETMTMLQAS
jgi:hypothetical protein